MPSHSAVTVDNNLATGQASVALRAADDEVAGRIYEKLRALIQHLGRQDFFDHFFHDEAANFGMFYVARVLGRNDNAGNTDRFAVFVNH